MKINKITIDKFKSFIQPTSIDFRILTGNFIHITGDIGAGKTTLGEAILYGLYGRVRNKPIKSLVSWNHYRGSVELELECSGHNLLIFRELRTQGQSVFRVWVDGVEISGSSKNDLQDLLERDYYDLPAPLMDMLCIISFHNFKSLSTMSQRDISSFLDEILHLNQLSPIIENLKNLEKNAKSDILEKSSKLELILEQNSIHQQQVESLHSSLDEEELAFEDYKNSVKSTENILEEQLSNVTGDIKKLKKQVAYHLSAIEKYQQSICDFSHSTETEDLRCPTCLTELTNHNQPTILSNLKLEIENHQLHLEQVRNEILKLEQVFSNTTSNLEKIHNKKQEYLEKISKISEEINFLNKYHHPEFVEKSDELTLSQQISYLEREVEKYNQLSTELQGKVRRDILARFTPHLNRTIGEYCMVIGFPYIPQFDDTFTCFITPGTIQTHSKQGLVSIESLSTGQTKMVDMIIILSILTTLLNHTDLNILFLDELFANLDRSIKNNLIQLLKHKLPNKKIMAISHEKFDNHIVDTFIHLKLLSIDKGSTLSFSMPE